MTGKSVDIGHELHHALTCGGTTDTTVKRDDQTAMTTLIGPDLEQLRGNDAVKAGPVKTVVCMVHLAGDSCHQGDRIGFTLCQGGYCFGEGGVICVHTGVPGGGGLWAPRVTDRALQSIGQEESGAFDRNGSPFAAPDADGGDATLEIAFFQCIQQRDHDACA